MRVGCPARILFLCHTFPSLKFYQPLTRRQIQKSQKFVRRIPSGGVWRASSRLECGEHCVAAESYRFLFDVNGKHNAAGCDALRPPAEHRGYHPPRPPEKRAQTRHRVVLVMSQHVLDVITTNSTRSRAEEFKKKTKKQQTKLELQQTNIFSSTMSWNVAFESRFKWLSGDTFFLKKKKVSWLALYLATRLAPFFLCVCCVVLCASQLLPRCEAFFSRGGLQKLSGDV